MGIRRLTGDSAGALTYDQVGFDEMYMDKNQYESRDYKIYRATAGTDGSGIVYRDLPHNGTPHWIGIHNCGTVAAETCSVTARSLVGDDLAKDGIYDPTTFANYIELLPADIIYGKFDQIALWKTLDDPTPYVDVLRLIRGV